MRNKTTELQKRSIYRSLLAEPFVMVVEAVSSANSQDSMQENTQNRQLFSA